MAQDKKFIKGLTGYKSKFTYVVSVNVEDFKKELDRLNVNGWAKFEVGESQKLNKFNKPMVYGFEFVPYTAEGTDNTTQQPQQHKVYAPAVPANAPVAEDDLPF